jgi:hypothetical protein
VGADCLSAGVGECANEGVYYCKPDGSGVLCSAVEGNPDKEGAKFGDTCEDFKDNDCDGFIDAADDDCASAYSDLGVTCSLPYDRGKPGADCNGWHVIQFDGGSAEEVQADLLALDTDGSLLATIENVQPGELAHLASRQTPQDFKVDSRPTGRNAPRCSRLCRFCASGKKPGVGRGYCGILPYGGHQAGWRDHFLSDAKDVDVDAQPRERRQPEHQARRRRRCRGSRNRPGDGVSHTEERSAPTRSTRAWSRSRLVGAMGTVPVGSGTSGRGLDTGIVANAKDGTEEPDQVNTVSFNLSGLPAGGTSSSSTATRRLFPSVSRRSA